MKICGGLLVAHGEILKYLFFNHNNNFVLPFEKSENTQYFLTTYLNQKKKNKTNIKTILIKVLFAVYSCHLIDLYFYCFPESTDFPHIIFPCPYFWRVCSFPQLPTAHLAVSSSCVSLGSLPTQEFSFGCNLIKPT